ncbi:MAG: hypothetical protein LBV02_05060 [Bacteroidales bacterium]|jgi:hypothetical protein|nr:hypothetical protein [Bacteroidales bacterium]
MISRKTSAKMIFSILLLAGVFSTFTATAQSNRYYWVGKGDKTSFTDIMNWSATSGGIGGSAGGAPQSPSNITTLVFDVNSFTSAGAVIQIASNQQCDSIIVEADCAYPPTFSTATAFTLTVNGSLLFKRAGVKFEGNYSPSFIFSSARASESIQTSGAALGTPVNMQILMPDEVYTVFNSSATYNLLDDFTCRNINITGGVLNLNGHDILTSEFKVGALGKVLFANSVIDCRFTWNCTPVVTATESAGSLIRIGGGDLITPANSVYNNVEFYAGTDNTYTKAHKIPRGSYNKVTILKGESELSSSSAPIAVDSLVINAAYSHRFFKMTVSSYFEAKPAGCGGQVRLLGADGNTASYSIANRTVTYNGTANNFIVERAVIHDLPVAGTGPFTAKKSYNWGNNSSNWAFTAPDAGRDMYWTGGAGNWGDPAHWADISGQPLNCVPTLADNVFFTASANTGGTPISKNNPLELDEHVWCHDMTWNGVPGNPYLRVYGAQSIADMDFTTVMVMIGGSLTLQSSLRFFETGSVGYMFGRFYFVGDGEETINTNGAPVYANVYLQSVSGAGRWTLQNDIVMSNEVVNDSKDIISYQKVTSIQLNRGSFNTNGKKVIASSIVVDTDTDPAISTGFTTRLANRQLIIANSTIDVFSWIYTGGQILQTNQSLNSNIMVGLSFAVRQFTTKHNDHYHNVEMRFRGTNMYNATRNNANALTYFNKITLNSAAGSLNSTKSDELGTLYPDSLLFTGYGMYTLNRNIKVAKYLGTPLACGGQTVLTAGASAKTIDIGSSIPTPSNRVQVRNTEINNIKISTNGALYPSGVQYAVTDCNLLNAAADADAGWLNAPLPPKTYYWVGGTGNWSDNSHWASTSGGVGGSGCVPRAIDNVFFDDNSFTAPNQTVTVNAMAYCDSMSWTGNATLKPTFVLRSDLYIAGSLLYQSGMTVQGNTGIGLGKIHLVTARQHESITSNGVKLECGIFLEAADKASGWILQDSLSTAPIIRNHRHGDVTFTRGTLNANGKKIVTGSFDNDAGNSEDIHLIIPNSDIYITGKYSFDGEVNAENSNFYLWSRGGSFSALFSVPRGAQYHNLYYYGDHIGNNENEYEYMTVSGGKFNKIDLKRKTIFNDSHTLVETDTLILSSDGNYIYSFKDTLRVNEAFYGNGTPCSQIYLQSVSETIPAVFDIKKAAATLSGDTLQIDYAYIHGISALTGADNARLYKGFHSPDRNVTGGESWGYGIGTGNYNSNWARMDAYGLNGTLPFGDLERILACEEFPYLLGSENFVPTSATRFKWFKMDYATFEAKFNATPGATNAEKFDNLTGYVSTNADISITGRGTFSLIVDYGNGCVSWDDIKITTLTCCAPVPLPVTSPQTFCVGSTVSDLQAEGEEDGIIHWYRLTGTDTVRLPGNTLLEDGATYYATQQIDSCESVIHDTIKALVVIIPKPTLGHPHPDEVTQSIPSGSAITDIVYDYGGSAAGATVSFTPSTGHSFAYTVDTVAKTVTIHGSSSMVDTVTYTVTALAGTYCADSASVGTLMVTRAGHTIVGTVFPFVHTGETSFDSLFMVTAALYAEPAETVGARKLNALLNTKPLYVDTVKYYDATVYIPGTPKNPGDFMRTDNPGLPIDWLRLGQTAGLADTVTVRGQGDLPGKPVGYYSFTVPPGEYVLVLSRTGYLDRYAKIVIYADSYLGHRELLSGDLNASRNITVADLSLIKAYQSVGFGNGLYQARYDLDGNKIIGQRELDMVLFYMGATYLIYPESRIWLYGE